MKKRFVYLLIVCLMLFLIGLISPAAAQGQNLLVNPGFEKPFQTQSQTVQVAQGWSPWFVEGGSSLSENVKPEYYPASDVTNGLGIPRIRSGTDAQQYHTFFATHDAGVYQKVNGLTSGTKLRFSVYVYAWSSSFDDVNKSEQDGSVVVQVGIDPTGGTDGTSANVVWSTASVQYDAYNQYNVTATSQGAAVTVFVRSTVSVPVKSNNIYIDDASLVIDTGSVPTNAPAATNTPIPTSTNTLVPTNTPIPTNTPAPAATNTPIPAATNTSSVPTVQPTDDLGIVGTDTPIPAATNTSAPVNTSAPAATFTPQPTYTLLPTYTSQPTFTPLPTLASTATPTQEIIIPATATVSSGTATPNTPVSDEFPGRVLHTVRPGDTVGKLADTYGSSVDAVIEANGLNASALIRVGQVLVVPVRLSSPATSMPTVTPLVPVATVTPFVPQPTTTIYVVQSGDTLGRIAVRFNSTVTTLSQLNGITNPNLIRVGQRLTIPVSGAGDGSSQPPVVIVTQQVVVTATPASTTGQQTYVVRSGDTLFRIALRFGVPLSRLTQANEIANPNVVYVGQVLVIP